MLVFHATVCEGSFLLWAETPAAEALLAIEGETVDGASPFAAGHQQLRQMLVTLSLERHLIETIDEYAFVWLPTRARLPVPSSGVIDDRAHLQKPVGLRQWLVPVLKLRTGAAADLLRTSGDARILVPGIAAGDEIAYLWQALGFAGSIVVRQRYLPGVKFDGERWIAVWEPIIAGADLEYLTTLVETCPGVLRAVSFTEQKETDQISPLQLVHQLVGLIVDHFVRAAKSPMTSALQGNTAADLWLRALRSADPAITTDGGKLKELQSDIARWKRPINTTLDAPFRLCLRLEEPEALEAAANFGDALLDKTEALAAPWRIRYLLQSTVDPSLIINACSVWNESSDATVLERTRFSAREYLLSSLGAASMVYPPVEKSLLSSAPGDVELTLDQAYEFLTHHAALLQESGFGVMLPAWWTSKRRKRLGASASQASGMKVKNGKFSMQDVVQFSWQVAIGDRKLSVAELEELAKLKVPLILVRGEWIEIPPEQLKAAIEIAKKKRQKLTVREMFQLNLGVIQLSSGLEFNGIAGGGWVAELLEELEGEYEFAESPPPAGFEGQLRPYQLRGYSWLRFLSRWGLGACLADDMGLGKTVQTLALIQKQWEETPADQRRPTLLICPTSVVANWQREAQRFVPQLPIYVHHGGGRMKGGSFQSHAEEHGVVLSSYALMVRDLSDIRQVPWNAVILDEAQNIKNANTKQAEAARFLTADAKIALTGTPVENNIGDLWSIMEFLNPGLLGTAQHFRREFLGPIQVERDKEALGNLKKLTQPFVLRRLKTDKAIIQDLPEKQEIKVYCNLTKEQATLYQGVLKAMKQAVEGEQKLNGGIVLSTLTQLKQVCNHPAQFLHDNSLLEGRSGKLNRLTEMLEETLQTGDRALVFTQFAEMGAMIKSHLQYQFGQEVLFLSGETSAKSRADMVNRFQNEEDGPKIFILSLKAGGVGLNLTRASQVFHFDRWWNPAVENQATDRVFRIGQKKNVQVFKLICMGTLEDKIDKLIEEKQKVAETIVSTGEAWLSKLNKNELLQVMSLSKEAVAE